MKLSGAFLIAAAKATPQPCGPRLEMSGLSGTFADLNGLWTFAMDGNGNVLQNQQKPYYKRVGGDDFMWWMWHGNTGHWVVNKTPGSHGDDKIKSKMADFACAQDAAAWEDASGNSVTVSVAASPCCDSIEWDDGTDVKTWTKTTSLNEEYPIYSNTDGNFMWWMWHGSVGHWVVNKTPGAHGNDITMSEKADAACPDQFSAWTMTCAATEEPPVDDGLNAANCAGKVNYKFRSGKAKVSRSGENSNLARLQQAKVKETKAHTGFVSFTKSACGKDFLAGLKDGRVTVDFADKKATYSVIGSYYVDNGSSTQVVVQYNSVPADVAADKCPKCLGNSSTDQLEMLVMGTKSIEWGSKNAKACLNGALVGHAGAAGSPELLTNDESGCVAWTNAL